MQPRFAWLAYQANHQIRRAAQIFTFAKDGQLAGDFEGLDVRTLGVKRVVLNAVKNLDEQPVRPFPCRHAVIEPFLKAVIITQRSRQPMF